MIMTHKIALFPTLSQRVQLSRHCGYARVGYNDALSLFKDGLDGGTFKSLYSLKREFNATKREKYGWCCELSQNASKNAIHDLYRAIENWLDKSLPARFPTRRKRSGGQSYRADNGVGTVRVAGKRVFLPKIGSIKMAERLRFNGRIKTATVIKTFGRWFVCLGVDVNHDVVPRDGVTIGIDMGLKVLATYSDGTEVRNPYGKIDRVYRQLRKVDKAIARSRKVHGLKEYSNRRCRLYDRRQRLYGRIHYLRSDVHHKATSALVRAMHVGKVVVESLNVSGLRCNKRLSRGFHRAGISGFVSMLKYKCEREGITFEKVDRWYASTQICSCCGHRKVAEDKLSLGDRVYVCFECGHVMDRDLNAAKNLAQYKSESGKVKAKVKDVDVASHAESLNGRGDTIRRAGTVAGSMKRQSSQLSLHFV